MKILYLTETLSPVGGIETYLLKLLPLLEGYGHENVVIYHQKSALPSGVGDKSTYHVPITADPERAWESIANIIQCKKPTLIYLHAISNLFIIEKVARLVPTVAYVHDFHPICPGLGKYFRNDNEICTRPFGIGCIPMIYLRRCASARHPVSVLNIMHTTQIHKVIYQSLNCVIVGSTYMRDLLLQNGFDAKRLCILPPHFEEPRPVGSRSQDSLLILFVGRLEPEKGLPYLLEAMTLLETPCRLRVAGNGTHREKYEDLVGKLNLINQVEFVGWLNDGELSEAYNQSRFLVVPAIWPEPFGKIGIEAMSHGRPVIASNVGGISDWLQDGINGYLVEPKDIKTLAAKIDQLLKDEALCVAMGQAGRDLVTNNYSPKQHIETLLSIFEQCIARA